METDAGLNVIKAGFKWENCSTIISQKIQNLIQLIDA